MAENTKKRALTKERLKNALIVLCDKKGYYDITILDICKCAGVYRSTFYRYYDTKDDILREIEHEYIEATQNLTPTLWSVHAGASPEELEKYRRELTEDMEYHQEHRQLCKFLLSPAGDIYFYNMMVESIGQQVTKNLQRRGIRETKKTDYLLNFVAAGFVSTIHRWLQRNDRSPSEIADFLLSMILDLQ